MNAGKTEGSGDMIVLMTTMMNIMRIKVAVMMTTTTMMMMVMMMVMMASGHRKTLPLS